MSKKQVKLRTPIKYAGAELSCLAMREPCVADEINIENLTNQSVRERTLFINLCEVSADAMAQVTIHDYRKLQSAYRDFVLGEDEPESLENTSSPSQN